MCLFCPGPNKQESVERLLGLEQSDLPAGKGVAGKTGDIFPDPVHPPIDTAIQVLACLLLTSSFWGSLTNCSQTRVSSPDSPNLLSPSSHWHLALLVAVPSLPHSWCSVLNKDLTTTHSHPKQDSRVSLFPTRLPTAPHHVPELQDSAESTSPTASLHLHPDPPIISIIS